MPSRREVLKDLLIIFGGLCGLDAIYEIKNGITEEEVEVDGVRYTQYYYRGSPFAYVQRSEAPPAASQFPAMPQVERGAILRSTVAPQPKKEAVIIGNELPSNQQEFDRVQQTLLNKYTNQKWATLGEMRKSSDIFNFYFYSIYYSATFLGCPWQVVLGIHNSEMDSTGFRPFDRIYNYSGGGRGPGHIYPIFWNGTSSSSYFSNMYDVERNGGNGFGWFGRDIWLQYKKNQKSIADLRSVGCDVFRFIDNVAATARGLISHGVYNFPKNTNSWTTSHWSTVRRAAMLYTSSSADPGVVRGSGYRLSTVGSYADNVVRAAKSVNSIIS